ncbi:hypothetical protein E7811_03930 [Aliigemmobacter aestuarii]|uniref:Uncharacterized protein n=2 Tax=Aliigemmobacter aestuarii TaxID=1445661 RepID=A0A4S3MS14_9RHOB|nr:hypothetical protein E7811_03930 [Gemmobacter aestuarii]
MKNATKIAAGFSALFLLGACVEESAPLVSAPAVGSASDLSDFEGARAGQAEMGITNLGYELIRSEGLTSYWFNRATGACAQIVTSDGRYSSITMLPAGDC